MHFAFGSAFSLVNLPSKRVRTEVAMMFTSLISNKYLDVMCCFRVLKVWESIEQYYGIHSLLICRAVGENNRENWVTGSLWFLWASRGIM